MHTQRLPIHDPGGLGIFALMAQVLMAPYSPPNLYGEEKTIDDRPKPAPVTAPKRGLLDRLEQWFWVQRQRDLEAYLAQSSDIHDLERRMRYVERNGVRPYY